MAKLIEIERYYDKDLRNTSWNCTNCIEDNGRGWREEHYKDSKGNVFVVETDFYNYEDGQGFPEIRNQILYQEVEEEEEHQEQENKNIGGNKMLKFRKLKANEIDVRVQSCMAKGCILLLYKDARCDMNILDETVGPMNWQRTHTRDNANCIVSLWDEKKNQWVSKEDTGTESNTEKEKGQASDSFKRACFNWGIGRELYTSPTIWVNASDCNIQDKNGRKSCYDKFIVEKITYTEEGRIDGLSIKNTKTGKRVFLQKPSK